MGRQHTQNHGDLNNTIAYLADDEDISQPGGEHVAIAVLDMDNVERSLVSLPGHDGSNSTTISTSSDHAEVASVEPDGVLDLPSGDVHLYTVVNHVMGHRHVLMCTLEKG